MEVGPQTGEVRGVELVEAETHFEFIVLAKVAQIDRAVDLQIAGVPLGREIGPRAVDELAQPGGGAGGIEAAGGHLDRAFEIDPCVGQHEAERGELAGMDGHDPPRDPGLVEQFRQVQRPGAAEREQGVLARVLAALEQHRAQRADHVVVDDAQDRERGLLDRHAQRVGDTCNGARRAPGGERHAPAEEIGRVDAAEHEVGIGDGGSFTAEPVARGTRVGARALGTDAQHPALVDPRDRAAAGADRADVDHGDLDRQPELDFKIRREADAPVDHGRAVRRRAAHVERHRARQSQFGRDLARRDDAACRPGQRQLHRLRTGGVEAHLATVRLDQHHRRDDAACDQALAHRAQVALQHRLHVGVGKRGGGAFVFLPLRQHVVGNRHRQVRQRRLQAIAHRTLVGGIDVGEQQVDGHRLDLAVGGDGGHRGVDAGHIQRQQDLARGEQAFIDLEAVAAQDQRFRAHPAAVVVMLAMAALQEGDVAEAAGRDIGNPCALAFEYRIGRHCRAQPEVVDGRGIREALQSVQDAERRVVGRGQVFPHLEQLGLAIVGHEVREGSADIDTDQVTGHRTVSSASVPRE